jgi:hypothetical protein
VVPPGVVLHGESVLNIGGNAGIQAARDICAGFRVKTSSDFGFIEARFMSIAERHRTMAANDSSGQAALIILRGRGVCQPRQRLQ